MRKITITLFFLIVFSPFVSAQSRIRELGLTYSGFNILGVRYKVGNENSLFRLTLLNIRGGNGNSKYEDSKSKYNSQSIGLNIGFQKLKAISNDVFFYYGADLLSSIDCNSSDDYNSSGNVTSTYKTKDKTFVSGLGCVLGFQYNFSSNVNLSAEIVPSVWYSISKGSESTGEINHSHTSKRIGYGFNGYSSSYANLTLSFRIKPKSEE